MDEYYKNIENKLTEIESVENIYNENYNLLFCFSEDSDKNNQSTNYALQKTGGLFSKLFNDDKSELDSTNINMVIYF